MRRSVGCRNNIHEGDTTYDASTQTANKCNICRSQRCAVPSPSVRGQRLTEQHVNMEHEWFEGYHRGGR